MHIPKTYKRAGTALLALALCLSPAALAAEREQREEQQPELAAPMAQSGQQPRPEPPIQAREPEPESAPDRPFYQGVEEVDDPDALGVLVNKYHALPRDYAPQVEQVGSRYGSGALRPEAAQAFREMADAARRDEIALRSVSAYRSYQTQQWIYDRYVREDGQELADTYSARPGHSEHQTGLALDINVASTSAHFEDTPAYAWLQEHCWEYGFILRYPQGKQEITGYRFEPWHYRYVGVEVARACMEQGLSYEEHLAARAEQADRGEGEIPLTPIGPALPPGQDRPAGPIPGIAMI